MSLVTKFMVNFVINKMVTPFLCWYLAHNTRLLRILLKKHKVTFVIGLPVEPKKLAGVV